MASRMAPVPVMMLLIPTCPTFLFDCSAINVGMCDSLTGHTGSLAISVASRGTLVAVGCKGSKGLSAVVVSRGSVDSRETLVAAVESLWNPKVSEGEKEDDEDEEAVE